LLHAALDLALLPEPLRNLEPNATYPVHVGEALKNLMAEFDARLNDQERSTRGCRKFPSGIAMS
jgi:hypothetical protein